MHTGKAALWYIYRPVLLEGCSSDREDTNQCFDLGTGDSLQLPGFGVEMAVKNMEYSALDDKVTHAATWGCPTLYVLFGNSLLLFMLVDPIGLRNLYADFSPCRWTTFLAIIRMDYPWSLVAWPMVLYRCFSKYARDSYNLPDAGPNGWVRKIFLGLLPKF